MDTKMNIYQRLNAVMKAVSYVQKEDKKVNNQYTFVSHDAVTAKVRPHLIENGVALVTSVDSFHQDGNRTEATVTLEFVNVDKPEDKIVVRSFGYGIDPQDKGPGKAVSYAVKYGLLKTLCLETGDDPERDNINHEPAKPKSAKSVTKDVFDGLSPEDQAMLRDIAMEAKFFLSRKDVAEAVDYIELQELDADLKAALWSLFESHEKSAMKKHKEQTVAA